MSNKEKIIKLYYDEHLQVNDISNSLNISSPYITKIIKQDSRYMEEKTTRKNKSAVNRRNAKNKFMKDKRDMKRIEDNYATVEAQHIQATKELSKSSHINNETYRKWNSSAYNYNPSKRRYEFDENLVRCYSIPKYIKER